jgi:pimeloyl-ACP methyl ester carboxylesterase
MVVARGLWCSLAILAISAHAGEPLVTTSRSVTLASLFPPEEVAELSKTLAPDTPVIFRLWLSEPKTSGVLIFVSPTDSGEPPAGWLPLLQQKHLSWIAADGFGNQKLSAQRILAAMMARELLRQTTAVDAARTYLGGMSGGGRIASLTATRFPQYFSGGLYIVGANYWMPKDARLKQRAASNRYVFITGEHDFNRSDMKNVFKRYQSAGLTSSLLMDLPDFAHEYPDADQLAKAIEFLDAR